MKKPVNTHEAKTQFSKLLKRVALGEKITIASRGKTVAVLGPAPPEESGRKLGRFKGMFEVPADFDKPLDDELLDLFYGKAKTKKKPRSARSKKQ